MAILLSAAQLSKSFGTRELFKSISFSIESGERVGLIGPNGSGKTTLLRILAGVATSDAGQISVQKGLRIGYLEQTPRFQTGATVFSAVTEKMASSEDWELIARAHELISKFELNIHGVGDETLVTELSGGWRKKLALAREMLISPDLLLLDEPTNHLDIESILWLEDYLQNLGVATLTITHDRMFLQRIANRILELDRRNENGLLSIQGDYATFLEAKEGLLHDLERAEKVLKNTLRRETEWLRRGAKARQTKQQGRIQRALDLQDEVAELKSLNQKRTVQFDFQTSEKNPKRLIEARGISKQFGDKLLFQDLNLFIGPRSRLGLLGQNGSGKTTLIQTLVGKLPPDSGQVLRAEKLQVAFFEQDRETLDPNKTLIQTLCPHGDHIDFRGKPMHVRGYLGRFLFSPEQMELPVGRLSGGEQGRLLLARLMLREANILVLDEPTNDLDMGTLQVLEECLTDFDGAIILVTHDRYFLDRVCSQILAFPPDQARSENSDLVSFADVAQWEQWHDQVLRESQRRKSDRTGRSTGVEGVSAKPGAQKKLSYKDQREWDQMEATISRAESAVSNLEGRLADPNIASRAQELTELTEQLAVAQAEVERLYARWAELESLIK